MRVVLLVFLLLGVASCATSPAPETGLVTTSGILYADGSSLSSSQTISNADISGSITGVTILADSKEKCKTVSRPAGDGCNTCPTEICTDGTTQWETGASYFTLVACVKRYNETPYDDKEWNKK